MSQLPPDLRAGLRDWADRPPRRDAVTAARLARALPERLRAPARLRLAVGALAAAACFALGLALASRLDRGELSPPTPVALAEPAVGASGADARLMVIELSSGTPLYVVLPPPVARRPT